MRFIKDWKLGFDRVLTTFYLPFEKKLDIILTSQMCAGFKFTAITTQVFQTKQLSKLLNHKLF